MGDKMAKKILYAAKVNVHENIFSQDLEEIITVHIPRAIKEAPSFKANSFTWSITDIKHLNIEDMELITGNLTKSKHKPIKVKKGIETIDVVPEYEQAQTSFFAYQPQYEILLFEVNSQIKSEDFIKSFSYLLSSDVYIGEVKIVPLPEPYKIRNEINAMDTVTSIAFQLIHPNPGKKEFNLYQQLIHENSAKEIDLKLVNNSGLTIINKNENSSNEFVDTIEHGIELVENGYGAIVIRGYKETVVKRSSRPKVKKNPKSFSSSKAIRRITVNEFGEEMLLSRLRSFILDIISKIKSRD